MNPDSVFKILRKSPYWGIMHDGLQKFNTDYIGVYIQGLDISYNPICIPFHLTKMKAGINACDIANALIEMIFGYNRATTTAFTTIIL